MLTDTGEPASTYINANYMKVSLYPKKWLEHTPHTPEAVCFTWQLSSLPNTKIMYEALTCVYIYIVILQEDVEAEVRKGVKDEKEEAQW